MKMVIQDFARNKENAHYDVCFAIIMSHGDEINNDTIIYGVDWVYISASQVQKYFTNENSKSLRGKPKVFLFQVCRYDCIYYFLI